MFWSQATCKRSGQDVVLKAYALSSLTDFLRNQVLRELHIHSRLENPGVVQLLAAFRVRGCGQDTCTCYVWARQDSVFHDLNTFPCAKIEP